MWWAVLTRPNDRHAHGHPLEEGEVSERVNHKLKGETYKLLASPFSLCSCVRARVRAVVVPGGLTRR